MKILINISNHLRDLGNRISLLILPIALISYVLGVILWYQSQNHYLLVIGLIIIPLVFFFKKLSLILLIVIFFLSLGALRISYSFLTNKSEIRGYGKVITFPKKTDYYNEAIVKIKSATRPLYSYKTFRYDKDVTLKLLDEIYFHGREQERLFYRNDNDYPKFYQNYLTNSSYVKANFVKKIDESPLITKLFTLREQIKESFSASNKSGKSFFLEVLFGEKVLQENIRDIFNKSGTAHLLSISGLHFSLTIFFAYIFVYVLSFLYPNILFNIPRQLLTIFFALPLLIIYGFLSGMSIPATRAFLVFILLFSFLILNKNPNYLSLLSLIALLFLVFEPNYIFSISFQLSFTSVFALIIFREKIQTSLINKISNRLIRYLLGIFTATCCVNLLILPIITNLQGKFYLATFLSNIFAIPLFSFFILPFLFISLPFQALGEEVFSFSLMVPELSYRVLVKVLNNLNLLMEDFSFNFHFDIKTSLVYYLFIISIFYLPKYLKLFALFIPLFLFFPTKDAPKKDFSAVFLDVHQGDASIIKSEKGAIVMIDCGGNMYDETIYKRAYAPFFRTHKIREISAIIISHHHPDHTKALKDIIENMRVKVIYLTKESLMNLDIPEGVTVKQVDLKETITIDDLEIELIPPKSFDKKVNNNSLWAVIKKGNRKYIYTGDTEVKVIDEMISTIVINKSDIIYLKVPHHGSKSSFSSEMYKRFNPKVAIISLGSDNIWNLPSAEVINFLRDQKILTLRTDILGQITIR